MLPRVRALELAGDGAVVRDELSGSTVQVKARAVVNATGVWAGQLVSQLELRPSRGSHLVLRDSAVPGLRVAVATPVPGEPNRFVLVLPQPDGRVYVGLTDEPVDGPIPDVPEPTESEIGALLDVVGAVFERPIRRIDVVGAFAGLRPLIDADGRTADLSRRHMVVTGPEGVVTVVGGKLTTYRRMAEDAVDTAVRQRRLVAGPSRTAKLPLVGAAPPEPRASGGVPMRLVRRYGSEAGAVVATARTVAGGQLCDAELFEPVVDGLPVTRAELLFGATHEGALDVADLLERRTRIGLVRADRERAEAYAREALHMSATRYGSVPHHPNAPVQGS